MALSTTAVARGAGRAAPRRSTQSVLVVAALTLLALLGTAACAPPEPVIPDPITVTPTIAPARVLPPEPQVPIVWPLTGVPTEEVAARPAIAVKVENTSAARPQTGLESADVVWETIVEFQVSRLVAVFHSQMPAEVGPIRSVRPMDPLIVTPLNGMLAFSGGQSGILALVRDSGVQLISHDAGAPGLHRVDFRRAPHNVYGTMQTFLDQQDGARTVPPPEQFAFALRPTIASAVRLGTPATTLAFRLSSASRPSWTWDAASGKWLRSEGSTASNDAEGARLSAVNVVSITAGHPSTRFRAQGGAPVPTYELVGHGPAVVATGGMVLAGVWSKAAQNAPLQLFLADGTTPLLLAPGNTWVELVPAENGTLTIS